MASQFMLDTRELLEPHLTLAQRIARSARRMNQMVGDLLDFTRSRLGTGLPIAPKAMDLGAEASLAVEEVVEAHPGTVVKLNVSGELRGSWDKERIAQLLSNLLGNAVQHGSTDTPISVTARGETNDVVLQVHNHGPVISPEEIEGLFSPFKRLASGQVVSGGSSSLGLGLYIVERIVTAHAGAIKVQSSEDGGTFFTVRLPREPKQPPPTG